MSISFDICHCPIPYAEAEVEGIKSCAAPPFRGPYFLVGSRNLLETCAVGHQQIPGGSPLSPSHLVQGRLQVEGERAWNDFGNL